MNHFDSNTFKTACSTCSLRELCIPAGMSSTELDHLSAMVSRRQRLQRGEALISPGQDFDRFYALRSGFFKTSLSSDCGEDQVAGFQIPGEVLGLDGVSTGNHTVSAIALEDSEVCVMMYSDIERLAHESPALQRQLHRVMSREIVREQDVMLLLGSMRAEQRVAAFLLDLSDRFNTLGYSPTEFVLRMTRQEIGSYLGLKLETVSRILSKFNDKQLICVESKNIQLLNIEKLKAIVSAEE